MIKTLLCPARGSATWTIHAISLLCLLFSIGSAGPTWAQGSVPEEIILEQNIIIERFSPPPIAGSVDLNVAPLKELIPAELAAQRTLTLRGVRIEGATLFPDDAFIPLWADLVGQEIPVSALYDLTDRIERMYLRAGILALAVVPIQDLSGGDIRIVVFDQSYIRVIETRGDYPDIRKRLAPYIDKLAAMQPLRIKKIERILLLMSDLAGMNIEATLRRPDTPGNGGSLTLEIEFDKRVARFSIDNRGTKEVGPYQAFGTFQQNDLFGLFESTTVTGATVPNSPRELLLGQIAQDFSVASDGLHVGYQFGFTDSRPGGALDALDVVVSSIAAEIYASYPILRTIEQSAVVSAGLRSRDTDVDVGSRAQSSDRYRWLATGLAAEQGIGFGSINFQTEYLRGIEAFNATDRGAPLASRAIAETDFHVLAGRADLAVGLLEGLSLLGRAAGQYAFGPLPSVVQMSFGGDPFGRAFDSGALSGDTGIVSSLELSLDTEPAFAEVRSSVAYAFADYGVTWVRGNDRANDNPTLGSVGVGFRAVLDEGFAIDATLAVPFEYDPGLDDTGPEIFFSLKKRF